MGRPLNKKFFANTNYKVDGEGVGGEGVASVAIAAPIAASMNEGATVTFSAPQVPGGQTATGTVVIDENGDIVSIAVTNAGSGYTSRPTITVTDTEAGGGETATLTHDSGGVTITLSTTRVDGILARGIPVAGGEGTDVCDIIEQVSGRRYKIRSEDGVGVCKLVTDAAPNATGEMTISAYDSAGGAYWVAKLTARKVVLVPQAGVGGGTQFASGTTAKWSLGTTAVENVSVYLETAA